MEDNHENDTSQMHMVDDHPSIQQHHHHHVHYLQEHDHGSQRMGNGNRVDDDGVGCAGGGTDVLEVEVPSDPGNLSENRSVVVPHGSENANQLTLSFQGQVYVFDSVSPEKVQAVLLLLGGQEVPPSMPTLLVSSQQYNKGESGNPQRFSVPQRLASLIRFREKRKERNFEKKIRYTVRKEVALRMQRNKGQFTSSKSIQDDTASAVTIWDSNQSWGSEGNGPQQPEIVCRHCGISDKSTPMMRRGPEGPRTLCNACGLMWANKGTLKDLSKAPSHGGHASFLNRGDENAIVEADQKVIGMAENISDSS